MSVGGLVGILDQGGIIDNCHVSSGLVDGSGSSVGGLVGVVANSSKIYNSSSGAAVSGGNQTGGLVGYLTSDSEIYQSSAYGGVAGGSFYVGGFVGDMMGTGHKDSWWECLWEWFPVQILRFSTWGVLRVSVQATRRF